MYFIYNNIESEHFPLICIKCCIQHEMKEEKQPAGGHIAWRWSFFKQGAITGFYDETMEGSVFPLRQQTATPSTSLSVLETELVKSWHQTHMETGDLNIESTSFGMQTEKSATLRQMYISAAVSLLNWPWGWGGWKSDLRICSEVLRVCCTVNGKDPRCPPLQPFCVPAAPSPLYMLLYSQ